MKLHAFPTAITVLATVALIGAAAAQIQTPASTPASSFDGKPIVVEKKGVHFGVAEHARFETVGTDSFVVFKVTPENGPAYEYWQPLSDISNIKVFDSLDDAKAYDAKAYAKRSSP